MWEHVPNFKFFCCSFVAFVIKFAKPRIASDVANMPIVAIKLDELNRASRCKESGTLQVSK